MGGRIWERRRPTGGSEFGFALRAVQDDDLFDTGARRGETAAVAAADVAGGDGGDAARARRRAGGCPRLITDEDRQVRGIAAGPTMDGPETEACTRPEGGTHDRPEPQPGQAARRGPVRRPRASGQNGATMREGHEWLYQLETMINDVTTQAAPVARQVAAKAAELTAVAAIKAGPSPSGRPT